MQELKQSTASQVVYIYLTDATDGYTPEVSVVTPTVYLSKNGGAAAVPESLAWAETDGTNMPGWYELTLSAVDTNTVGPLGIDVIKAGTSRHFATVVQVKAAHTDDIKTDTAAILADTGTAGVLLSATATSAALVDAVWDELTAGHVAVGTTGKKLSDAASSGDPWATDISSGYAHPEAGYVINRIVGGAGSASTTITVTNEDGDALEGVRVDLYTASTPSEATYYTGGYTGTAGTLVLYLPTAVYYGFRHRRGYDFSGDPVTITVS